MTDRLDAALAELADAIRAEVQAEVATSTGPGRMLSVDQAANLLGVGRSALYAALASGQVRSVKVGRRRLIPSSALTEIGQEPGVAA